MCVVRDLTRCVMGNILKQNRDLTRPKYIGPATLNNDGKLFSSSLPLSGLSGITYLGIKKESELQLIKSPLPGQIVFCEENGIRKIFMYIDDEWSSL